MVAKPPLSSPLLLTELETLINIESELIATNSLLLQLIDFILLNKDQAFTLRVVRYKELLFSHCHQCIWILTRLVLILADNIGSFASL